MKSHYSFRSHSPLPPWVSGTGCQSSEMQSKKLFSWYIIPTRHLAEEYWVTDEGHPRPQRRKWRSRQAGACPGHAFSRLSPFGPNLFAGSSSKWPKLFFLTIPTFNHQPNRFFSCMTDYAKLCGYVLVTENTRFINMSSLLTLVNPR